MRLSTSTCIHESVLWGSELHYSCADSIRACAKAGYQVLDMNFHSYSKANRPMTQPGWEGWIKDLKELSDSLALEWHQGHAYFYDWHGRSKDGHEYHDELIRRSIVGAGILGVKWLVIHPGNVRDDTWYSHKKSLQANLETYRRYGELAARNGVGIAIENMIENQTMRRFASSTEELLELYEELNDPLFGICWDTGHGHLVGIDQAAALCQIGKRLKALHINDNHGQYDDHTAPYFGTMRWEPILKALGHIQYDQAFTFEIHNFTNGLPDGLHDQALRFTFELGTFMVESICRNHLELTKADIRQED